MAHDGFAWSYLQRGSLKGENGQSRSFFGSPRSPPNRADWRAVVLA